MPSTTRQDILSRLGRLSELAPDMRFGQLIANLAFMAAGPWDQTLWDLEDEPLLGAIRQMESDLAHRARCRPRCVMELKGVVRNGVIVPDDPTALPEGRACVSPWLLSNSP